MTSMTPFLMFQGGKGEAALDFYVATIPDSRLVAIDRFGPGDPGPEGTIKRAHAIIAGQAVMVHDSFVTHGFDFTPSFSFFVDCGDERIGAISPVSQPSCKPVPAGARLRSVP